MRPRRPARSKTTLDGRFEAPEGDALAKGGRAASSPYRPDVSQQCDAPARAETAQVGRFGSAGRGVPHPRAKRASLAARDDANRHPASDTRGPPGRPAEKTVAPARPQQAPQAPAPGACACVTSAQVEDLYSAAAAGGAKMTFAQIASGGRSHEGGRDPS